MKSEYLSIEDAEKLANYDKLLVENINVNQKLNEIKSYIHNNELNNNLYFMDTGVGDLFDNILKIIDRVR